MNKFKLFGSLFFVALSVLMFYKTFEKYELSKTRNFVTVKILKLPDCAIASKGKFIHIEYQDTKYILRTKCKYVDSLLAGQKIMMLHKPNTKLFIFRNEAFNSDL